MNNTKHASMNYVALSWVILSLGLSPAYCKCKDAENNSQHKYYYADVKLYSMKSDEGLESYRSYGGGGVGPRGTLGLGASSGARDFNVAISGSKNHGRFNVRVTVEPKRNDSRTAALDRVFALSELQPQTLEIARDDDGRVYRLSLFPHVVISPGPKIFRAADLKLDHWSFHDSQIILNDQDYLGQMNLSSSPIAWIDIPGLAKVEFSLLPLTGAAQEGVLRNGTIDITHNNKTRLRITNVRNGVESEVLQGGPYHVWIRWLKPSQTVDQYRESWKKQLSAIRQQIASGDLELPQGTVERLQRLVKSDRILQVNCGARCPQKGELLEPSR